MDDTPDVIAMYSGYSVEAMLRDIDPLFSTRPVYVICKTLVNRLRLPQNFATARGWTGNNLSEQCRPYLESIGQWRGPGFCLVNNLTISHWTDPAFLATCVHEAAHWCQWQVTLSEDSHGPTWIRAALHLSHRASGWFAARGIRFSTVDALSNSGLSSVCRYIQTLSGELGQAHKPTCWHLRQPAPLPFMVMCNVEAQRNRKRPPFPQLVVKPTKPQASTSKRSRRVRRKWSALIGGRFVETIGGRTTIDGREVDERAFRTFVKSDEATRDLLWPAQPLYI